MGGAGTSFRCSQPPLRNLRFSLRETFMKFVLSENGSKSGCTIRLHNKKGFMVEESFPHSHHILRLENLPLLFPHKTAALQTFQVELDLGWCLPSKRIKPKVCRGFLQMHGFTRCIFERSDHKEKKYFYL